MKRLLQSRLRLQLSMLVLLAVIPIWALALYNAGVQNRFEANIIQRHTLALARSAAVEESQKLDATRQMLIAVGHAFALAEGDVRRFAPYLASLSTQIAPYLDLGIAARDGTPLIGIRSRTAEVNLAQQTWFKEAVASHRFAWGIDRPRAFEGRAVVYFAQPQQNPIAATEVVAYAVLDLSVMNTVFSRFVTDLPEGSRLLQIDGSGTAMIYAPADAKWLGPIDLGAPLREALQSNRNALVDDQGPPGTSRQLVAFAAIPGVFEQLNRRVAIVVPYAKAFAQSQRLLKHSLLLLICGTLLALGMVWLTAEYLVLRRVRAMAAASRRLAAGDLTARIGLPQGKDELAQLALVFDEMAEALAQREAADKAAREKLQRSREQLRNLAGHLQAVREEERTRIAREIHDDFGQALTILKMDLAWIAGHPAAEPSAVTQKIGDMAGVIDQSLETLHRVSAQLRPVILDDFGLSAAIQWQAEDFQTRTGVVCRLKLEDPPPELSREQSTAVFRIFQEILTNITRHAAAHHVDVALRAAGAEITLIVEDDGRGIETAQIEDSRSFGLIGMRERLYPWNGQIRFEGRPHRGTRVTVRLPLPPKETTDDSRRHRR